MGQNVEIAMRILIAIAMEFANQFVQYKDQKAMEGIEDHVMKAEYASETVLVKFQV